MTLTNLSLMTKVALLIVAAGLVAIIGSLYASWQFNGISQSYSALLANDAKAPVLLTRGNRNLSDVMVSLFKNAAATTEKDNADAVAARDKAFSGFSDYLTQAKAYAPSFGTDIDAIGAAVAGVMSGVCGEVAKLSQSTDPAQNAKALARLIDECQPQMTAVQQSFIVLNDKIIAYVADLSSKNEANARSTMILTTAISVLSVFVVVLLAMWTVRSNISKPLSTLLGKMQTLRDGRFDIEIGFAGRREEIGQIALGLEEFRKSLAEADAARRVP